MDGLGGRFPDGSRRKAVDKAAALRDLDELLLLGAERLTLPSRRQRWAVFRSH